MEEKNYEFPSRTSWHVLTYLRGKNEIVEHGIVNTAKWWLCPIESLLPTGRNISKARTKRSYEQAILVIVVREETLLTCTKHWAYCSSTRPRRWESPRFRPEESKNLHTRNLYPCLAQAVVMGHLVRGQCNQDRFRIDYLRLETNNTLNRVYSFNV